MGVELRAAAEPDLDAVVEIHARLGGLPYRTREQFASELRRPESFFLIAGEGGELAAYATARCVAGELQIELVAVSPARTRRGIGRLLVGELLARARAAGCSLAVLEVGERNPPARGL